VLIHVTQRTGDELAEFYAAHANGRVAEKPESERQPSSEPARPRGILIEAISTFRVGQEWRQYADPEWHEHGFGRFFKITGSGLAQLQIQREQVESIRAAGVTNGVTYMEIVRRAKKESDRLIQEAQGNVEFELCDLYSVVCELHRHSCEILRGTRGTPLMRPNEFVSSFLRLEELLRRAKQLTPLKLHLWPNSPATQFAGWSEDSALHIVLHVADALVGNIGWTR
jgi:hypothetical protein